MSTGEDVRGAQELGGAGPDPPETTVRARSPVLREALTPALLPGALAFAVFVVFAAEGAGYAPTIWYPGALFLVALGAVALPRLAAPASRAVLAAIGFLLAYTAWSFASIAWSDVRADAWDGANRTLLYLVVYVLFALLPWSAVTAALLLGAYSFAVAVLGTVVLLQAASAANPEAYFLLGRFAEPAGYQNANCALFLTAFFPAVFLASRREVPALARAAQLAAAGVLLELALLTQSRTSLVALPVTLLVYLALVPGRLRALAFVALPVVAAALARGPLLDVFTAFTDERGVVDALEAARGAVLATAVALFALGLVAAAIDRRIEVPQRAVRVTGRALVAAAAAALLAGAVAAVARSDDVGDRVERAWDEFRTTETDPADERASRFSGGLAGNRYDVWRVAVLEFEAAPLHGAGADNFAVAYARERRSREEPLYPHSLELRVLSQTGIVGGVLFAGFLVAALAAVAPLRRRAALVRGVGAAAVAVFAYWLVHGSVDWFWEIAGLGAPALAAIGVAASLAREREDGRAGLPRLGGLVAALVAVVAAATFVPPWLSAKEVQAATATWRADPEAAFDHLERARTLNRLTDNPDLIAGAIASRLGDRARMRAAFARALERNPYNWYAHLELAVVDALEGRRAEALRSLELARRLSPTEPAIALVNSRVRAGQPISPAALDRFFLRRVDPKYRLPPD